MYGMALGIGVQLHATTLLLYSLIWCIVATYILIQKRSIWRKLFFVLLLALFLNITQIISELQTGFINTRILFHFSEKNDLSQLSEAKSVSAIVADTISCHIEGNVYMLFSLGRETCNYSFVKIIERTQSGEKFRETNSWSMFLFVFIFSVFGYSILWYRFCMESDKDRKYFLGLMILFSAIFFLLMLPIVGSSEFKEFRYFSPVFFVPFLFVGLLAHAFSFVRKGQYIVFICMLILIFFGNIRSISDRVVILNSQRGNNGHSVYYGEVENIIGYIQALSGNAKEVYVMSEKIYTGNIFLPGAYVAEKFGYAFIRTFDVEKVPIGSPLFFLAKNKGMNESFIENIPVKSVKNFGSMRVYQLEY